MNKVLALSLMPVFGFCSETVTEISVAKSFVFCHQEEEVRGADGYIYYHEAQQAFSGVKVGVGQVVNVSEYGGYYYGASVNIPLSAYIDEYEESWAGETSVIEELEKDGLPDFSPVKVITDVKFGGLAKPFTNANYSFKLGLAGNVLMSSNGYRSGAVELAAAIEAGYRYHLGDEGSMDIEILIPTEGVSVAAFNIGFSRAVVLPS